MKQNPTEKIKNTLSNEVKVEHITPEFYKELCNSEYFNPHKVIYPEDIAIAYKSSRASFKDYELIFFRTHEAVWYLKGSFNTFFEVFPAAIANYLSYYCPDDLRLWILSSSSEERELGKAFISNGNTK